MVKRMVCITVWLWCLGSLALAAAQDARDEAADQDDGSVVAAPDGGDDDGLATLGEQTAQVASADGGNQFERQLQVDLVFDQVAQFYRASLPLGTLPVGAKGTIAVTLRNPSEATIVFDRFSTECACRATKTSATEIPPGGTVQIETDLLVANQGLQIDVNDEVALVSKDGDKVGVMHFVYRVGGVLKFGQFSSLVELSAGQAEASVFVPILVSEPVAEKNLQLAVPSELQPLRMEFTRMHNVFGVQIDTPETAVADGPLSGILGVQDRESGKRAELPVTVRRRPTLKVSPSITWLRPLPDSDDGEKRFGATVILSLDRNLLQVDEHQPVPEVQFGGHSPDPNISFETISHSNGIARIKVRLAVHEESSSDNQVRSDGVPGQITWFATVGDQRFETVTEFEVRDLRNP